MNTWELTRRIYASARRFSPAEKLVLTILAHYTNRESGACYPTMRTTGKAASMSERNVRRVIRDLEGMGALVATGRSCGRRSSEYHLNMVWIDAPNPDTMTGLEESATRTPGPGSDPTQPGHHDRVEDPPTRTPGPGWKKTNPDTMTGSTRTPGPGRPGQMRQLTPAETASTISAATGLPRVATARASNRELEPGIEPGVVEGGAEPLAAAGGTPPEDLGGVEVRDYGSMGFPGDVAERANPAVVSKLERGRLARERRAAQRAEVRASGSTPKAKRAKDDHFSDESTQAARTRLVREAYRAEWSARWPNETCVWAARENAITVRLLADVEVASVVAAVRSLVGKWDAWKIRFDWVREDRPTMGFLSSHCAEVLSIVERGAPVQPAPKVPGKKASVYDNPLAIDPRLTDELLHKDFKQYSEILNSHGY